MAARSTRLSSRTAALLAVTAVHCLVLWVFWRTQLALPEEPDGFTSLLFWVPARQATQPPLADQAAAHVATARGQQRPVIALPPATDPGTTITLPSNPHADVDWSAQLAGAAKSELDRQELAAQQLGALTRKYLLEEDPRNPPRAPASGFRWYQAGIHRIDTRAFIPVLHVNDRCVLVAFIFPACAIGHIEIHGDLFDDLAGARDEESATARPNDVP